jgi:NAD(P)-dependent dehydrogenase (short-subunit alcohol dehydrogenase family)
VTGGTSGIGKTTAIEFARAGAKVVLSGRRKREGADVVAEIEQLGAAAAFIRADIAKAVARRICGHRKFWRRWIY